LEEFLWAIGCVHIETTISLKRGYIMQTTLQKIYTIKALSNLHCGIGQGVDDIDLPTAKEKSTGFPYAPGSSIKGVLRDHFSRIKEAEVVRTAFGPDFSNATEDQFASAFMITDARILFLPVRSFAGVFAYCTCPFVLERFSQDIEQVGYPAVPSVPDVTQTQALVPESSENRISNKILLEDLDLTAITNNQEWALWTSFLKKEILNQRWAQQTIFSRITLVSNDVFSFLCRTALPVVARTKINQKTGTVQKGGLWYEESLPAETILTGITATSDSYNGKNPLDKKTIMDDLTLEPLFFQLGGKASTGKGLCLMEFKKPGGN